MLINVGKIGIFSLKLPVLQNLLVPGAWLRTTPSGSADSSESPLGVLNLTGDGTNRGIEDQSVVVIPGEEFSFEFEVFDASVIMRVGTSRGGSQIPPAAATYNVGTYKFVISSLSNLIWFRFERQAAGTGRVRNIKLTRVPLSPLRVSANRGVLPTVGLTAGANSLRSETRKLYTLGGEDLNEIRLAWAGFFATATTENTVGNNQAVQAAIEIPGAPTPVVRVTFSGNANGQITNGQNIVLSDKVVPSSFGLSVFEAGMSFYVRDQREVTSGQVMSGESETANMSGESTQLSNGASPSQLMNSGPLTTPSGGSAQFRRFGPTAVLGRAVSGNGDIAVLDIGDSLVNGADDTNFPNGDDGTSGGGFIKRALRNCNGRSVPHLSMAISGSEGYNFRNNMTRRSDWMAFCTHLVENYGTNDFENSSRTPTQVYEDRQSIWATFKSKAQGSKYIGALPILLRTTSTNSFIDAVGQTPRTGYEIGGNFKDPMNANLQLALSNNFIEELIDINSAASDPSNPEKWKTTGQSNYPTADGTHPSPALSIDIATPVRNSIAQWS